MFDGSHVWTSVTESNVLDEASDKVLCKLKLSDSDITKLKDAIEDLYYFEFVIGKYSYEQCSAVIFRTFAIFMVMM